MDFYTHNYCIYSRYISNDNNEAESDSSNTLATEVEEKNPNNQLVAMPPSPGDELRDNQFDNARRSTLLLSLLEQQQRLEQQFRDEQRYTDVYDNSVDMRKLFNDDPLLHQDILNYLGSRPMKEKIIMSKARLLPSWPVQILTIVCFWLVSCGLCCVVCGIVGVTSTNYTLAQSLKLLKETNLTVSWLSVWLFGALLIILNFLVLSVSLLIYHCVTEEAEDKSE